MGFYEDNGETLRTMYCIHTDSCALEVDDCLAGASVVEDPCEGATCDVKPRARAFSDQDGKSQEACVVSQIDALEGNEWTIENLWSVLEPHVVLGDDVISDLVRVLEDAF